MSRLSVVAAQALILLALAATIGIPGDSGPAAKTALPDILDAGSYCSRCEPFLEL